MFVKFFSDPIFVFLLACFYCVFVAFIFQVFQARKVGLQWLKQSNSSKKKGERRLFEFLLKGVRAAFSASEAEMVNKFISAGFYKAHYAAYYMPIKYFSLFIGMLGFYYLSNELQWDLSQFAILCTVWLIVVVILPDSYLAYRAKSLQIRVSNKLPYLIDLLAVCVQTGMTIEASMSYLSSEMMAFDEDLGHLLNKTNDRTKIVGLEQAIEELRVRVPTAEMRSFVMTLNQSLQYGTSIYSVLTKLSAEIREVQMLGLEEKIGKLSAKMSVPLILFVMFPIVVIIVAPGIMRIMS